MIAQFESGTTNDLAVLSSLLWWLLIWFIVGAVIGHLIGKPKGRSNLGAWLGGLFGFIGWIAIALIPRDEDVLAQRAALLNARNETARRCPYCSERINTSAIVCRWCGRAVEPLEHRLPFQDALDQVAIYDPTTARDLWNEIHSLQSSEQVDASTATAAAGYVKLGMPASAALDRALRERSDGPGQ